MIQKVVMNNLANQKESVEPFISPLSRIIIAIVTALSILINILYVFICFKTLKKKFHNLLVLSLCVGDSILSLSLTWFSLVKLSNWTATNVNMCRFQIFTVAYGLIFTYSIVFLICYERYLVVKNYNFGVQDFFERFRFVIIGGTLSLGFMFTIETVLFIPHVENIAKCTVPELYGEQYRFFIELFGTCLTSIMAGVIIFCIRTSMLIWKLFFKASRKVVESGYNFDESTCEYVKEREDVLTEVKEENQSASINSESRDVRDLIRQLVAKMKKDRELEENEDLTLNRKPMPKNVEIKVKFKPDAWEKRAFVTTIIIAASTVFFTGPFIFSYWIDYFYGEAFISTKVKLYLFVPLVLNSISNPFIYAWRIPEIKQALKNMFTCRKSCKKKNNVTSTRHVI